jgi:hypothetical protein
MQKKLASKDYVRKTKNLLIFLLFQLFKIGRHFEITVKHETVEITFHT